MNTKNMKRIVLYGSVIVPVTTFVLGSPLLFGFCQNISESGKYCYDNNFISGIIFLLVLSLSPLLLLLSLITYRMHDSVFHAWWNFARFMVPIIIVATLWLNKVDSGSGLGSGIFTTWVLSTMYAIFITTSLWKIIRAYYATKK